MYICVCMYEFSPVQSLSLVRFFAIPWTAAPQASLSITNSQSLLKLMSIESVMPSNHFIPFRPLLLLPSIFPTIRVVSNDSVLHIGWPKYWSLSFSISPSNEYLGLISLAIDWFDLLAVQGTLKSLLQHHSSKISILWCSAAAKSLQSCQTLCNHRAAAHQAPPSLGFSRQEHWSWVPLPSPLWCSAFFIVPLSQPYRTTGKTIPLTRWTFVGKVMTLLFNMLSRLIVGFLPRSKCLLIAWLQSPSAVILEPQITAPNHNKV